MWDDDIDAHIMQQTFFTFLMSRFKTECEYYTEIYWVLGTGWTQRRVKSQLERREPRISISLQVVVIDRHSKTFLFFFSQTFLKSFSSFANQTTKKRKLSTMTFQLIILKWISHCTFIVRCSLYSSFHVWEIFEKVRNVEERKKGRELGKLCTR